MYEVKRGTNTSKCGGPQSDALDKDKEAHGGRFDHLQQGVAGLGVVSAEVTIRSTPIHIAKNDIPILHKFLVKIFSIFKKHKDSPIAGGISETNSNGGRAYDADNNPKSTKGADYLDITGIWNTANLFQGSAEPQPQSTGLDLLTKGAEAMNKALETKEQIERVNDAIELLTPGPQKPATNSKVGDTVYINDQTGDTLKQNPSRPLPESYYKTHPGIKTSNGGTRRSWTRVVIK